MKLRRIALGVLLMAAGVNTAFAEHVKTHVDKRTNFGAYKTFMWIKEPNSPGPLRRERVVEAINAALTARGFQLVTSDADLCVAAHTATNEERTLSSFYEGIAGGWRWDHAFGSANTTRPAYEVGTLVVDIFDRKTKEAIWRGTSSMTRSENPQKVAEDLNKDVVKMFRNVPPTKKSRRDIKILELVVKGIAEGMRR